MEIHEATEMTRDYLSAYYPPEEIKSLIPLIFEYMIGYSGLQLHLKRHDIFPEAKLIQLKQILKRLQKFEPVQYILGESEFYGLKFIVNPSVLIPRPETEELVEWILKDSPPANSTLLDIGAGSGCIAVSIAKNRPDLKIESWDISVDALTTARNNAKLNEVKVDFSEVDILNWRDVPISKKYDIIVSNPPYVTRAEESSMLKNVIEHEPHLALFVSNEEPLLFYNTIAEFAIEHLNPKGHLYFEINEQMSLNIENLLKDSFLSVTIKKDIHGKDRMVKAIHN